jgi:hypothetical protein
MTINRYGSSAMPREDGIFCLYSEYEKVVAERDALLATLAEKERVIEELHYNYQLLGTCK